MKKKVIILISFIVIVCVVGIFRSMSASNYDEIKNLLYEKYGENFKIVHDMGNEYEGGLLPSFKKTGYKNVIASSENNEEIKFNVRLKLNPLEIVNDDYVLSNIAYNTSKEIEKNYSIGNKMYVYTSAAEYKCDGKAVNSFFDNLEGKGSIGISIYVEGLDSKLNYKEYLNKIIEAFNFDSNTKGTIILYSIKENGIQKIKDYYKNSKDMVKVENSDLEIRRKYFETQNKDDFINF